MHLFYYLNLMHQHSLSFAKKMNETTYTEAQKHSDIITIIIIICTKKARPDLAASYCFTVSNVSSIVLLQSVLKLDVKKFNAPSHHKPHANKLNMFCTSSS